MSKCLSGIESNVQFSQNGSQYELIVSNAYGQAQSQPVTLTVVSGPPQIYVDVAPINLALYAGRTAAYSVHAIGTLPIYYQWYQDGAPIANATHSNYAQVVLMGMHTYACVVSNAYNGGSTASSSTATLTGSAIPTNRYAQGVLSKNPIAYWRLDETGGTVAYDYVGGYNGNVAGGVVFGQTGALFGDGNTSYGFDGASGNVNLPYTPGLNPLAFTVELWVKCTGGTGVYRAPFMSRAGSPLNGFNFYASSGNTWQFWTGNGAWNIITGPSVVLGQWVHLVGSYDGTNQTFYVNGQLAGTIQTSFIPNTDPASVIRIGAASSSTYWFPGYIDDVAIYNYGLDATQALADYQAGIQPLPELLTIQNLANQVRLQWNSGTLQTATEATGPYYDITNAASPYTIPTTNAQQFFRVRQY
ncbi:MAG: hypothetical protein JWR26_1444 [Pedosphaera sp.]|nr:hypothetical protein [Pedosphaera sp.]